MKIVQPSVTLEAWIPEPAAIIERAGRTCYRSEHNICPGSAARFVRMLVERGHLSVLEHVSATLRIVSDRGVSHELVRHRIASFAQESTRYCRYDHGIEVIEPPGLSDHNREAWMSAVAKAERAYLNMLDADTAPQIARAVLPTCLRTEIVMTANAREWLHVLELRESKAAHPQMRQVASMMRAELAGWCPELFAKELSDV